MQYVAFVTREGDKTLAEFPDAPGCQTFAEPGERIEDQAADALAGWLRAWLVTGEAPPRPGEHSRAPRRARLLHVPVPSRIAAAVIVRWAREDGGLTQVQLAQRMRVSQAQVAKLESSKGNPSVETLEKVARALGRTFAVTMDPVSH